MKPTLAMQPFFDALQDIIRADEPAPYCRTCGGDEEHFRKCWGPCERAAPVRQFSCNACLDSGELSEGGPCNWCRRGDE